MANPHPDAARRFLDSLDDDARAAATATFADEQARRDWHYIPRRRPGLCLCDMTAAQQKAAVDLLRAGLSEPAYATACLVMALEDVLDAREQGAGPRRGRQRGWGRHRAEYHVVVFGDPADDVWAWRFEGHHVSVTVTLVDGEVAATPQFLGANPMAVAGSYRLLGREQDLAFAVVAALGDDERAAAVVADVAPDDILTTNAPSLAAALPPEEGVVVGDLGGAARSAAAALLAHYAARLPDAHEVAPADADRTRFVFAGVAEARRPHYYRLQGPALFVEYDNTQDDANHAHSVVRHPARDFGDDLLRRHRAAHHRG